MAETKKKVRKPKKVVDEAPAVEETEKAPPVKKTAAKKAAPSVEAQADVTLVGCVQLVKHGRKFLQGKKFTVFGEEQIKFFKADARFNVVEK